MFKKNFIELCAARDVSPTSVCVAIGLSNAAYSTWTDDSVPRKTTLLKIAKYFNVSVEELLADNLEQVLKGVKIPVYGTIAAGIPIEAIQDIIDYEEIPVEMARGAEYIALQVKGDSMEPLMSTGDVVIIRVQHTIESGQIAAVLINGDDATIKKVVLRSNGLSLIASNPVYSPINFTAKEVNTLPVTIIGRAVEVRRKL